MSETTPKQKIIIRLAVDANQLEIIKKDLNHMKSHYDDDDAINNVLDNLIKGSDELRNHILDRKSKQETTEINVLFKELLASIGKCTECKGRGKCTCEECKSIKPPEFHWGCMKCEGTGNGIVIEMIDTKAPVGYTFDRIFKTPTAHTAYFRTISVFDEKMTFTVEVPYKIGDLKDYTCEECGGMPCGTQQPCPDDCNEKCVYNCPTCKGSPEISTKVKDIYVENNQFIIERNVM